jgi:uncharacterized protein (DUF1800 family)
MDERTAIAWLARRVGFGLAPGQLDELTAVGLSATLDRWLDPSAHGVAVAPDPWAGVDLSVMRPRGHVSRLEVDGVIGSWLQAMVTTPRPLEEWMRWFWHGHFVSTLGAVGSPPMMRDQLRTLGQFGLGDFPSLLRAVTVDPAMLVYLNGSSNRKGEVNENYGREVLELFTLGLGHFSEADVRAGATALTGYGVDLQTGICRFNPALHDDTPQHYLGQTGVHDVDSVVDAIVSHPACGPFIAGELARAVLGPDVSPGFITSLAKDFVLSGLQLRPLMRAIVEAGVHDGASTALVLAPVPWTMSMIRATGVSIPPIVLPLSNGLSRAGQLPLAAPNVGGWPGGSNWLTASATLGRFDLAATLAVSADPAATSTQAAGRGDWSSLADSLGHPEGFSPPTRAALDGVAADGGAESTRTRLALAMAAPELVLA